MSSGVPLAPPMIAAVRLDVHLGETDSGMAAEVRAGLTTAPKELSPKYFYDERGCTLFEHITALPEYYQTRTELGLLQALAPALVDQHGVGELVELGSGAARKTTALLDAMRSAGTLRRFLPFDVAPEMLLASSRRLASAYPGLYVHAVAGDFGRDLGAVPPRDPDARRLVAFLGGTIGNLYPEERTPFLRQVGGLLGPEDLLLVGTDLVGDPVRIEAAYNDGAGVTAEFNRNLLQVLNRELDAAFVPERFAHVARYRPDTEWIEMALRSECDQSVRVEALDLDVTFAQGEELRTEVSCKFTRASVEAMYADAGLALVEWHTDPRGWFAVSLAARAA